MSTPNEPQNPYGAEPPKEPDATPQYPATPPAAPQYPSAPQYPGAAPQPPEAAPQYPSAPQYGAPTPYPPAAPPYGAAPGGYAPAYGAAYPKNSLAVWSLVLGIVSFVLSCGLLTGIPAIIVGNNAKKAVARGEANNGGMATAGVILGWIAIALSVIGIILFAVLFSSAEFRDAFNEGYNTSY